MIYAAPWPRRRPWFCPPQFCRRFLPFRGPPLLSIVRLRGPSGGHSVSVTPANPVVCSGGAGAPWAGLGGALGGVGGTLAPLGGLLLLVCGTGTVWVSAPGGLPPPTHTPICWPEAPLGGRGELHPRTSGFGPPVLLPSPPWRLVFAGHDNAPSKFFQCVGGIR